MRLPGPVVRAALAASVAVVLAPACSLGSGTGTCTGTLDVPDCWSGPFDLHPDFFAAVPTASTGSLQLRIQHGGDYETFSDALLILVDDVGAVRGAPTASGTPRPSQLGHPLVVTLPPGVTPPGVPISPTSVRSVVHATLSLDATCRTQNDALYAVAAVSTNPDGSCTQPAGGDPPLACGGAAGDGGTTEGGSADAGASGGGATDGGTPDGGAAAGGGGVTTRSSTITFDALFDGDPAESNPADLLTDATFHFYLADPREICPGGLGPPPRCRGELTGSFRFYFQRGRPAQPFP